MRIRLLAALLVGGLGLVALSGCHDGYSSVGYSYYGSYGSPGYYDYCAPRSYSSYSFSYGHHDYGGHHRGHGGHHGGGHYGGQHCH